MKSINITRQSNFELLRIIAMILIVISHYAQHGMTVVAMTASTIYKFLSMYFYTFGQIGVTIFVLITGYFLIDKEFKLSRIIRIATKAIFYSYLILILSFIFAPNILNLKNIIQSLLPISTSQYWFVTTFILLGILSPLLNIVFRYLNKRQIELYLSLFIFLWFILSCTYKITYCGSALLYFIVIYFIGAYLKTYNVQIFEKKYVDIIVLLFTQIIVCAWILLCIHLNKYNPAWFAHLSHLNSIFTLLASVSIFTFFKNTNISYNNAINKISSGCFSVYIITENCLIRKYIWIEWFHCLKSTNIDYVILNVLFSILVSFAICICADILTSPLINKISNKLEEYSNKYILNSIGGKI